MCKVVIVRLHTDLPEELGTPEGNGFLFDLTTMEHRLYLKRWEEPHWFQELVPTEDDGSERYLPLRGACAIPLSLASSIDLDKSHAVYKGVTLRYEHVDCFDHYYPIDSSTDWDEIKDFVRIDLVQNEGTCHLEGDQMGIDEELCDE